MDRAAGWAVCFVRDAEAPRKRGRLNFERRDSSNFPLTRMGCHGRIHFSGAPSCAALAASLARRAEVRMSTHAASDGHPLYRKLVRWSGRGFQRYLKWSWGLGCAAVLAVKMFRLDERYGISVNLIM